MTDTTDTAKPWNSERDAFWSDLCDTKHLLQQRDERIAELEAEVAETQATLRGCGSRCAELEAERVPTELLQELYWYAKNVYDSYKGNKIGQAEIMDDMHKAERILGARKKEDNPNPPPPA